MEIMVTWCFWDVMFFLRKFCFNQFTESIPATFYWIWCVNCIFFLSTLIIKSFCQTFQTDRATILELGVNFSRERDLILPLLGSLQWLKIFQFLDLENIFFWWAPRTQREATIGKNIIHIDRKRRKYAKSKENSTSVDDFSFWWIKKHVGTSKRFDISLL